MQPHSLAISHTIGSDVLAKQNIPHATSSSIANPCAWRRGCTTYFQLHRQPSLRATPVDIGLAFRPILLSLNIHPTSYEHVCIDVHRQPRGRGLSTT